MTVHRVVVSEVTGAIVEVEYHPHAAAANESATAHRQQGRRADMTEGTVADDGTFTPAGG